MSRMTLEAAGRRIQSFNKSFGQAHLYLACHAAFPIALTPDLLYLLWKNFQRDINGEQLEIPWIAVADLLLSSLCNEVGHELYEMDVAVRNILLKQLQENQNLGKSRIKNLSNFLLGYIQPQLYSEDQDIQDLAHAQRLTALAYSNPNEAARELALALAKIDQKDTAELLRITSLVETLAEPLSEYKILLNYSRGMANFVRGKIDDATVQFLELLQESQLKLSGVTLPIPERIKANLSVVNTYPNKSLSIIGGGMSAILITVAGNFGLQYLQPAFLKQLIPNTTPTPQPTITTSSVTTPNVVATSTPKPEISISQEPTPIPSPTPTLKPSIAPSTLSTATNQPTIPTPLPTNNTVKPTATPFLACPDFPLCYGEPNTGNINPSVTPTPLAPTITNSPSPSSTSPSITSTSLPTTTTSPLPTNRPTSYPVTPISPNPTSTQTPNSTGLLTSTNSPLITIQTSSSSLPLANPSPEVTPGSSPRTIIVNRFDVEGNTVFSDEDVAKVLAPFTNRPISFKELLETRDAIAKLYFDRGFIFSGAFLPQEQVFKGDGAVIQIEVVEGTLAEIQIIGTQRVNSSYIRERILPGVTKPLNVVKLENQLRLLKADPLFANIQATLKPGKQAGESILTIQVTEANPPNQLDSINDFPSTNRKVGTGSR